MSDYESHSGKLKLLKRNEDETFEAQCQRLWLENGKDLENYDYKNDLFNEFSKKYIKHGDDIYEMIDYENLEDEDSFCRINKNEDGTLSFHTRFYNGGTWLGEMIEYGLNKFKK